MDSQSSFKRTAARLLRSTTRGEGDNFNRTLQDGFENLHFRFSCCGDHRLVLFSHFFNDFRIFYKEFYHRLFH